MFYIHCLSCQNYKKVTPAAAVYKENSISGTQDICVLHQASNNFKILKTKRQKENRNWSFWRRYGENSFIWMLWPLIN